MPLRRRSSLPATRPRTKPNRPSRKALSLLAMTLPALLASSPPARAGRIEGRLFTAPARTAGNGSRKGGDEVASSEVSPVVQRGVGDAVVYIERIPEEAERKLTKGHWWRRKPEPKLPRIVQADLRFEP